MAICALTLDSPEAAEVKALWKAAYEGTGMTDSARMRQFGRAARMATKLDQPKAEEEKPKEPPEETDTDALGTDTGPGSRGASKNLAGLMKKNPLKMTPKELKAYEKDLWSEAGKDIGVTYKLE